jgi:hypothetical protein
MTYIESKSETAREQERLHSQFHDYATGLVKTGNSHEQVMAKLIEQGIEPTLARNMSTFAAVSYHSARSDAIQQLLQRGLLYLVGGLAFTAFTYAMAAPGGIFVVATGAIGIGALQCVAALLMLVNKSYAPEDALRIVMGLLLLLSGIGAIVLAELWAASGLYDIGAHILDGVILVAGYLLAGAGVWGLVDKSAMRLRTGDPAVDALTPHEVGKAGKFLLIIAGVIVLHLIVSNLFLRSGDEGGVLSTLFSAFNSPFNSPLVGE